MKLTVQAGALLDGLRAVQARAKGRGNVIPILGHILFDVSGARLTLMAHDLDAHCEAFVPVEGHQPGSCTISAAEIVGLVSALPKEMHLEIECAGGPASIKAGRSRYKLPTLLARDFPDRLPCVDAQAFDLSDSDVRQLFERPLSAMDKSTKRIQISGGFLHSAEGLLTVIGTDAIHMVCYPSKAPAAADLTGVIVPANAMAEIAKIGAGRLLIGKTTIGFETDDIRFVSKLVDATFPPARNAMPPLSATYVEVDRAEMLEAVGRLASVSDPGSEVYLTFGDQEITAVVSGKSDGMETVVSSGEAGDQVLCAAAHRLKEVLSMPRGEVIQLHMEPNRNVLRIVDPSEPSAIFVEWCRLPKTERKVA